MNFDIFRIVSRTVRNRDRGIHINPGKLSDLEITVLLEHSAEMFAFGWSICLAYPSHF